MRAFGAFLGLIGLLSVAHGKAILEPSNGSYFGSSIDFQTTNVQSYLAQTGVSPVVFNVFVSLPMNSTMLAYMQSVVPQIAAVQGIVLLTVEPDQGFAAVTTSVVQTLASYIAQYEKAGASVMIRYAHEMNGNWYIWGQQPTEFIASTQMVAQVLRNNTCGVAMVWAPNGATGYPWSSGQTDGTAVAPQVKPGTADFKAMDTNGDGVIDSNDDPYLPFYPGDAYVDWVGMSSFHFGGQSYPYTQNVQAAPMAFIDGFTGTGNANFYGRFCNDSVHNKPMVITETSAMYNPSNSNGQSNFQIKSNWWQQVFNVQGANSNAADMAVSFPKVKAILWFDELKQEPQAGNAIIDWRFSANQQILSGLSTYIAQPAVSTGKKYWLQLSDFTNGGDAINCNTAQLSNSTTKTPVVQTTATSAATVPVTASPAPSTSVTTSGNTTTVVVNNASSPAKAVASNMSGPASANASSVTGKPASASASTQNGGIASASATSGPLTLANGRRFI